MTKRYPSPSSHLWLDLSDGGGAGRDANDDKRIELKEWLAGFKGVQDHGFIGLANVRSKEQAKEAFNVIDDNGVSIRSRINATIWNM